jgi:hypothetical protein
VRGHCGNPRIGVSFDGLITKKSGQRFKTNLVLNRWQKKIDEIIDIHLDTRVFAIST